MEVSINGWEYSNRKLWYIYFSMATILANQIELLEFCESPTHLLRVLNF